MIVAIGLGTSSAAQAESCPTLATPAQVDALASDALHAWAVMDVPAFEDSTDELVLVLPCLGRVVDEGLAARIHTVLALRRYRTGGVESALPMLRAAWILDPNHEAAPTPLSEGHELLTRTATAVAEGDPSTAVPRPAQGQTLWFDGLAQLRRPTDRAALLQLSGGADAVSSTVYLLPGDPMPAYLRQPRLRTGLAIAAGVLAAAAGGAFGGAWAERARFDGLPASDADGLRGAQASTNALTGASAGLAAGALSTAIAAAVIGRR